MNEISNQKEVPICKKLYEKIEQHVRQSAEFNSVQEYVTYVLEQVVEKIQEEKEKKKQEEAYSKEEEEKIKERLRGLGYLD